MHLWNILDVIPFISEHASHINTKIATFSYLRWPFILFFWRLALTSCKEKSDKNRECKEQIEEAISWYNRVLGFRIESGHGILLLRLAQTPIYHFRLWPIISLLGIKFIFTNISPENPNEEYSFVVRHENETYYCK